MNTINKQNSGLAMIVLLLVTSIVVSLILQVSMVAITNVSLDNEYSEGYLLLVKADGITENAGLKFLRNPNYIGETITENGAVCTVSMSVISDGKDIITSCLKNGRTRKMGMSAVLNNGVYQFSPIRERP